MTVGSTVARWRQAVGGFLSPRGSAACCLDGGTRGTGRPEQLRIYEILVAGHARRHEVFDIVCTSANQEDAEHRLRDLLRISEGVVPGVLPILDSPMSRWTQDSRDAIEDAAEQLRRQVRDFP